MVFYKYLNLYFYISCMGKKICLCIFPNAEQIVNLNNYLWLSKYSQNAKDFTNLNELN